MVDELTDVARANDKYRAQLRSTWITSPADTSLLVTAVPENVPTYVVVGWETDLETVFRVEGKTGTNSSNYALTGVTVVKGAGSSVNLPENTAVNCLNNEEFFNQYETKINEIVGEINTALADIDTSLSQFEVAALTDGATVALDASAGGTFTLSAGGNRTILVPTNAVNGKKIVIVHHAVDEARTLTLTTGEAGAFIFGEDVTELTETTSGKRDYIGCIYNSLLERWVVVAYSKGY
jgi:hypothetical protein